MPSEIFGVRPSRELRRACESKAAELGISVHELARRALTAVADDGWRLLYPRADGVNAGLEPGGQRVVYDEPRET